MPSPEIAPVSVDDLFALARQAAQAAYAPYSQFKVGAAILGQNGRVYTGFNVENASYGLTICAERVAAVRALSDQCASWKSIAVVSPASVSPCGSCRQFLAEFGLSLEVWIGSVDPQASVRCVSLQDLLPDAMALVEAQPQLVQPNPKAL